MVRLSYTHGDWIRCESRGKRSKPRPARTRCIFACIAQMISLQIAKEFNVLAPLFQRRKPAARQEKDRNDDQPNKVKQSQAPNVSRWRRRHRDWMVLEEPGR